jgi:hypothetical protein
MALMASNAVLATENGGSIYPNGNENYLSGAMPPPGVYALAYLSSYQADSLRDNTGAAKAVDFRLNVSAVATRVIWVTQQQLFGGQLAWAAIAPWVTVGATVNGNSQTKSGLGDMTFGPALGWNLSESLHLVAAVDVNAPTGQYNQADLINPGRNYWNMEPVLAISYVQQHGVNADLKLMYDINGSNQATHYRSGQELHADYALGWGFGQFVAGVGGYVYQQVTDDSGPGAPEDGNRGRAVAIGPSFKYDNGKGWFITAKYEKEFLVENRPRGGGWNIKLNLPF